MYLYTADTWTFSSTWTFPPEPCQRVAIFIQQNQLFSVLQFGARIGFILIGTSIVFFGGASDRDETNTECNMQIGVAWIFWVWEPQTDTKPIAICSEILPFLCTYTPPHAHLAPLQLFLQSLAKEFLCVVQQNKWLSVLQFRTRIVFPIGRLSTFD